MKKNKDKKKSTLETILSSAPVKIVSSEDIPLLVEDVKTGYLVPNPLHPDYIEHKAETSATAILAKHSKGKGKGKGKGTKGYVSPFPILTPVKEDIKTEEKIDLSHSYISPFVPSVIKDIKAKEKVSSETQIEELKARVLLALNDNTFELPFFSETIYNLLLKEGKILNVPTENRLSQYHSLPYTMPYNEEYQERGFSGKRGRMFFSLCIGKSANDLIALERYNRRKEGNDSIKQMTAMLYYRTLQAQSKAYFPEIHKAFKAMYPVSAFKPAKVTG